MSITRTLELYSSPSIVRLNDDKKEDKLKKKEDKKKKKAEDKKEKENLRTRLKN